MICRVSLKYLGEYGFRAGEPDELRILVEGDPYRSRLLSERLEDRLAHPPDGVRDELDALIWIELANGFEETFVADRDELGEIEPVSLILLHVRDDESKIRRDQPLRRGLVSLLRESGEASFLGRIRDQREFLYVLEILVERGGRR